MKVTCDRAQLANAFQSAAMVVPNRTTARPILSNVLFEVRADGSGRMVGTDLEMTVVVRLNGLTVTDAGSVLLPVKTFGPIVKESADETLTLSTKNSMVTIAGAHSNYKLTTAAPSEYPCPAEPDTAKHHRLSAALVLSLLRRTGFATANDDSRYALSGMLLEFLPAAICAVGTDGRRLATMAGAAVAVQGHAAEEKWTIVPSRALQVVERVLADPDEEVQIACVNRGIVVQTPGATLISRLVEGRYPDWRSIMPQRDNSSRVEIVCAELQMALRQASITTNQETRGLDLTFSNGSLQLSSNTAEVGESKIDLPLAYTGPNLTVTIDYRFVLDFLARAGEKCELDVATAEDAVIFRTADGYQYVVMPLASK